MLYCLDQCQLFLQTWAQQTRLWGSLASLRFGTSKMFRQYHLPLLHQDHYLKKQLKKLSYFVVCYTLKMLTILLYLNYGINF